MHVNFNFLSTFLLVAEQKSFRRASELAFRSQSAVSMQIRQLEQQLGVVLFHRTTRAVELTPEGEHMLEFTHRALAELHKGLAEVREAADLQRGKISFGCVPTLAGTILPRIAGDFERKHPAVIMAVEELASGKLMDGIHAGTLEFGIGPEIEHASEFFFEIFADDPAYALVPKKYWSEGMTEITFADLASLPLISFSSNSAFRTSIDEIVQSTGLKVNSQYEVQHVQTQIAMAEEGLAVAIVPSVALTLAKSPNVRPVRIVEPAISRKLAIITRRGRVLSPLAKKFIKLFVQVSTRLDFPTGNLTA